MVSATMTFDPAELVSDDGSRISRRLFTDDDVYRAELRSIFARSWLMVGHECQVPGPGDFVQSRMGEESVILARGRDGRVRVMHNSCAHRAMKVCRADRGNAATLSCPYHGWQYGIDGALLGVPKHVDGYRRELDKEGWGLRQARVELYGGLVFATFDGDAPSLDDYLGDMRWYLDLIFDRHPAGMELGGGTHRWIVDCNWKAPAENQAADLYHADFSHASTFELQGAGTEAAFPDGVQATVDAGHFMVVDRVPPDGDPARRLPGVPMTIAPEVTAYFASVQPIAAERLGPVRVDVRAAVGTVFPNFSVVPSSHTVRLAHPLGPDRTEIWSWSLVPADAPDAVKQQIATMYSTSMGPAGLVEQEDGENWTELTRGCVTSLPEDRPLHVGMGLGHEFTDPDLPGQLGPFWSEHNQRNFYRTWRRHLETTR